MQIILLARSETLRPRLLASHGSHLRLQEYSDYDPIAVRWVFSYLYSGQFLPPHGCLPDVSDLDMASSDNEDAGQVIRRVR